MNEWVENCKTKVGFFSSSLYFSSHGFQFQTFILCHFYYTFFLYFMTEQNICGYNKNPTYWIIIENNDLIVCKRRAFEIWKYYSPYTCSCRSIDEIKENNENMVKFIVLYFNQFSNGFLLHVNWIQSFSSKFVDAACVLSPFPSPHIHHIYHSIVFI